MAPWGHAEHVAEVDLANVQPGEPLLHRSDHGGSGETEGNVRPTTAATREDFLLRVRCVRRCLLVDCSETESGGDEAPAVRNANRPLGVQHSIWVSRLR